MTRNILIASLCFASILVSGQVNRIKEASAQTAQEYRSSESGSSSSNSNGSGFFVDVLMFLPNWQMYKLQGSRERYPLMVSVDVMLQGAFMPADTYVIWPRIRGNWGLFSTDFRMNYMMEKNDAGGFTSLRTNDWQILQLNIITSRFITARIGGGIMTESFGANQNFTELTAGFGIHAPDHSNAFYLEYRDAYKSGADFNARVEFSAQYQHQIFQSGALRGYLTAGGVYQKYYGTLEFWGLHGGVVLRFF